MNLFAGVVENGGVVGGVVEHGCPLAVRALEKAHKGELGDNHGLSVWSCEGAGNRVFLAEVSERVFFFSSRGRRDACSGILCCPEGFEECGALRLVSEDGLDGRTERVNRDGEGFGGELVRDEVEGAHGARRDELGQLAVGTVLELFARVYDHPAAPERHAKEEECRHQAERLGVQVHHPFPQFVHSEDP